MLCSLCSAKSGSQSLQNSASELDIAEDLKRKLCQAKEEKVDIIIKHNQEVRFFCSLSFESYKKCKCVSLFSYMICQKCCH